MRALVFGGRGLVQLPMVKPCARCTVPGVDPQTGTRDVSTGAALMRVMRDCRAGKYLWTGAQLHRAHFQKAKNADEVFFGQNALVRLPKEVGSFEVAVGDLAVVER
eukprot:gb/GFBE01048086.1/.p1 GENE.gb/GFBE01048086.1/~~gb/GFBE01048086.1/.p1  ORF type:complete len:106 (+),score=13.28 gb/GFBE01048086.1/:1-318(+)